MDTFEKIKHIDEFGNEYWLARELMPILEYTLWQRFTNSKFIRTIKDGEDCVKGLVVNSWVEEYDNVDKDTKKKLDGLVSYIWNFRTYREIIVCTSDKQVLTMELHKNIPL